MNIFEQIAAYYREVFSNPNGWFIAGQILGLVIVVENFFIYIQKKRSNILILKLVSDILNVPQQIMVGALTGGILCSIGIPREIVFYFKGKKKWADSIWWLFIFSALMLISPLISWKGPISLFAAVGSVFAVIGFYCKKPWLVRLFNLIAISLWLVYSIVLANIGGALSSFITIVSIVIGFIRDIKAAKAKKKETVDAAPAE